jgi:predicted amidohydrolase YtcJ
MGRRTGRTGSTLSRLGASSELELIEESGISALTTDAFWAATFNLWVGISWVVSGKSGSGSEVLVTNNPPLSVEALRLFTSGPAWFMDTETEMGMIAPGNLADFVLLDRAYFAVREDQIQDVSSILTVMDGGVVFGAQEYGSLTPALPAVLPDWSPVKHFGGYHSAR